MAKQTLKIPEDLQALIQQFLTDGVLTDKERQVILREAEEQGLKRDVVNLYLDAEEQKIEQATDAAVRRKKGKECPHCGAYIPQMSDKCPECDEYITPEASKELEEILEKLEDALVNMKDRKDFDRSKATVERYARKARMYYSNHPKIKSLLLEVDSEMKFAEKQKKSEERKEAAISALKSTGTGIGAFMSFIAPLFKSKWFWAGLPCIVGFTIMACAHSNRVQENGGIIGLVGLVILMFTGAAAMAKDSK